LVAGALLVALLSGATEAAFALFERFVIPAPVRERRRRQRATESGTR
jgi:hypothetical protein